MSDIRLPFQSLENPRSGIRLVNALGENITDEMLAKYGSLQYQHLLSFLFMLPFILELKNNVQN